jgi:hypothetical protein
MWAGSAFATPIVYEIVDNTLVGKEGSGGTQTITGPNGWVDVIASDPTDFNIIGVDIWNSAGSVYFDFYTNFDGDGDYEVEDSPPLHVYVADVGIDTDLDGTFDYGFCLKDHGDWDHLGSMWWDDTDSFDDTIDPGVYKITSPTGGDGWLTSRNFWESNLGHNYGGHFAPDYPSGTPPVGATTVGPNNAIASGEKIGGIWVDTTGVPEPPSGPAGGDDYRWRVKIHEDILKNDPNPFPPGAEPGMGIAQDQEIDIFWGGTTCSNDIFINRYKVDYTSPGDDPIPEPGTLLLVGFGLLGLAGYTIHRKKKS